MTMETKLEMQKYIDEHIKSIAVERREDKFYGTLIDKEGRTFEFSKDVIDVEKQFSNIHKALHKDVNLKELMLLKYFKRLFVVRYAVTNCLKFTGMIGTSDVSEDKELAKLIYDHCKKKKQKELEEEYDKL